MEPNPSLSSQADKLASRQRAPSELLAELDANFDTLAQTIALGATAQLIAEQNIFRTYLRIQYVSGLGAQFIFDPYNPTSTYLLINQQNPYAEFFIEKDKQMTTSKWLGVQSGGACTITVLQTIYRGP